MPWQPSRYLLTGVGSQGARPQGARHRQCRAGSASSSPLPAQPLPPLRPSCLGEANPLSQRMLRAQQGQEGEVGPSPGQPPPQQGCSGVGLGLDQVYVGWADCSPHPHPLLSCSSSLAAISSARPAMRLLLNSKNTFALLSRSLPGAPGRAASWGLPKYHARAPSFVSAPCQASTAVLGGKNGHTGEGKPVPSHPL